MVGHIMFVNSLSIFQGAIFKIIFTYGCFSFRSCRFLWQCIEFDVLFRCQKAFCCRGFFSIISDGNANVWTLFVLVGYVFIASNRLIS
ncbi:hypothetical protein BgiBS90_003313 [Biomphalaria glabrata]|nr:hypothetical protein BgiBS90_003313 [Biomphalaria glabrata]